MNLDMHFIAVQVGTKNSMYAEFKALQCLAFSCTFISIGLTNVHLLHMFPYGPDKRGATAVLRQAIGYS